MISVKTKTQTFVIILSYLFFNLKELPLPRRMRKSEIFTKSNVCNGVRTTSKHQFHYYVAPFLMWANQQTLLFSGVTIANGTKTPFVQST